MPNHQSTHRVNVLLLLLPYTLNRFNKRFINIGRLNTCIELNTMKKHCDI